MPFGIFRAFPSKAQAAFSPADAMPFVHQIREYEHLTLRHAFVQLLHKNIYIYISNRMKLNERITWFLRAWITLFVGTRLHGELVGQVEILEWCTAIWLAEGLAKKSAPLLTLLLVSSVYWKIQNHLKTKYFWSINPLPLLYYDKINLLVRRWKISFCTDQVGNRFRETDLWLGKRLASSVQSNDQNVLITTLWRIKEFPIFIELYK